MQGQRSCSRRGSGLRSLTTCLPMHRNCMRQMRGHCSTAWHSFRSMVGSPVQHQHTTRDLLGNKVLQVLEKTVDACIKGALACPGGYLSCLHWRCHSAVVQTAGAAPGLLACSDACSVLFHSYMRDLLHGLALAAPFQSLHPLPCRILCTASPDEHETL